MKKEDPAPMSLMHAVQYLRMEDPARLTNDQARELYQVLENTPEIHVLAGSETVERFRTVLEKRLFPKAEPATVANVVAGRGMRRMAVAALVVLAAGGAWFFTQQENRDRPGKVKNSSAQSNPAAAAVTPAPARVEEATAVSPAVPGPATGAPVPAPDKAMVSAPPAEPAVVEGPQMEVLRGGARLDPDGAGGYRLSALDGETKIRLTGTVKNLQIDGLNGRAELDASGLTAARIDFRGLVDGTSSVKLHAPGGTVVFHDIVGGATKLEIDAPDGRVNFEKGDLRVAKVIGGTRMKITARAVDFAGGMEGGSRADITLTNKGSLRCVSLTGGANLVYRKSAPGDIAPEVEEGRISEGGRLIPE